jgi:hypothetical protein
MILQKLSRTRIRNSKDWCAESSKHRAKLDFGVYLFFTVFFYLSVVVFNFAEQFRLITSGTLMSCR